MRLPASRSGILPQAELDSARLGMRAVEGAFDREYECSFETPIAGSVYGPVINEVRQAGRIIDFEYDRGAPVFSTWDLGWADCTSIWLFQIIGRDPHWIWHTRQTRKTAAEMAKILDATGIVISAHLLPHDAVATDAAEGRSYKDALTKAGLVNLVVVPRTTNIWTGIDSLRDMFARSWFHKTKTALGVEAIEAYATKDTTAGGNITKEPIHNWASHDADACRIAAEALDMNMLRPAAARALFNPSPRFPDGSIADIDFIKQTRASKQSALAKSGSRRQ
jgi:hypothetical protein